MSNITLQVEFLAGTSIIKAAEEAKALACKLDLAYVKFDFNGVEISVGQCANVERVESKYLRALGAKDTHFTYVIENGRD